MLQDVLPKPQAGCSVPGRKKNQWKFSDRWMTIAKIFFFNFKCVEIVGNLNKMGVILRDLRTFSDRQSKTEHRGSLTLARSGISPFSMPTL